MVHTPLSPAQQQGYDELVQFMNKAPVVGLVIRDGCGRTTILQQLAAGAGAPSIRMADVFARFQNFHPFQFEEALADTLLQTLTQHDTVIVDDFHVYTELLESCYSNPRPSILRVALDAVLRLLESGGKRLILGLRNNYVMEPLYSQCLFVKVPNFATEDLAFLLPRIVGPAVEHLDFERIRQFVPRLTAHQMRYTARQMDRTDDLTTEAFLDFLEKNALFSNVRTEQVEEVTMENLKGVEEVIHQLEVDIVVPMERPDLVRDLGLSPKRGVLLYGPPGTGKTTIGRALAHRLRSKFFLIDGTIISGTASFYDHVNRIFTHARDNAPSIIFIDDCDLLFENDEDTGLYRYMLTMLDGLQSKDNTQVTVILTAMNIGSLPPALIRSGRVELWLEMTLPDAGARAEIISEALARCPVYLRSADPVAVGEQTRDLTGADLRRIVADAVNLYGFDVAKERDLQPPFYYFEQAVRQLRKYRRQLETAPPFTAAHRPSSTRARIGFYSDGEEGQ